MQGMVHFQDGWGDEHHARQPVTSSKTEYAIPISGLPFYAEIIRALSRNEWLVFEQLHIKKVIQPSAIARALGFGNSSDASKYIARIEKKLSRLQAHLTVLRISVTETGIQGKHEELLSRPQPARHQVHLLKKWPLRLESTTRCQQAERENI